MEQTFKEDKLKLTKTQLVEEYATAILTIESKDTEISNLKIELRDIKHKYKQLENEAGEAKSKLYASENNKDKDALNTLRHELEESNKWNEFLKKELLQRINFHNFFVDSVKQALSMDEYVGTNVLSISNKEKEVK